MSSNATIYLADISAKIVLWIIITILFIRYLGFNVTSLLAGVGIAGIAIAFALQNILADIFAYFSIYFDRPFEVGDFIITGTDMGTVKKIGIKSTRIQTLHGEELIISNKELTEARINNYKSMEKRRVIFTFGVTYDTAAAKMKKIPSIIKDIITKIKGTTFNRAHFKTFGASSLDYEVVYHVNSPDYNNYMDIQQQINFELKARIEKMGVKFAFPTQTIYMKQE